MSNQLYINPIENYEGVLDFDGSTNLTNFLGGYDPSIAGIMDIEFKLYIDSNVGNNSNVFAFDPSNGPGFGYTCMFLLDSSFYVSQYTPGKTKQYPIGNYDGQILNIAIRKSEENQWGPISFKINGEEQIGVDGAFPNPYSYSNGMLIGGGINRTGQGGNRLKNATCWDWTITEVSTGNLIRRWKGYPEGNTNGAWTDEGIYGDFDLTISTTSTPGTRDMEGTSGSPILDLSKKLSIGGSGGTLLLQGTSVEQPFFSFTTDSSAPDVFGPLLGVSGGGLIEWDLGDGSTLNSNYFLHEYSQLGDKTVKMYEGTMGGASTITTWSMSNMGVKGDFDLSEFTTLGSIYWGDNPGITSVTLSGGAHDLSQFRVDTAAITFLDLSGYPNLSGQVSARNCSNLSSVLLPDSSKNFSLFRFDGCNLSGTIDISALTGLGGTVWYYGNDGITQILNPVSDRTLSNYNVYGCDLTGTLDWSGWSTVSNLQFQAWDNPNLTGIINPTASGNVNVYLANLCNLTGVLDVSGLTGLGGQFRVESNPNLTNILFPNSSNSITLMFLNNSGLTGTLDLSGLTGLGGFLNISSCPSLNQVIFPTSSVSFSFLTIGNCGLTGNVDVSGLTGLAATVVFADNSINSITFPASSGSITSLNFRNNEINTPIDLSGLTLRGNLSGENNSEFPDLTLPATFSGELGIVRFGDCSLNETSVDNIFSKINTYYSSNTPTSSLEISTDGGTNMPPTDGSSNSDILNLETIFGSAGQTLTININTA